MSQTRYGQLQALSQAHHGRTANVHREGTVPTIVMRIPKRQEIAVDGRRQVSEALRELGIAPETVLVIKGNRLLTRDAWIDGDDVVEVRPVMSGGC
jgi:sulfur carrier protein